MDKKSAFSLVELMVAVGIVGVLVTLALPRYQQFMVQARRGEAKSNLSHIATLQETYKVDHFSYYSGAAMSGTNGVGYKDGLGNPGNCSDPSDDRDEGINNHLGFRPNGCGQLRYFYQLRNSGNTAVASAASDAKGRHIFPDCDGRGGDECDYVSGDAVRLAMNSGKPEVCRNITNYCPLDGVITDPPPCPGVTCAVGETSIPYHPCCVPCTGTCTKSVTAASVWLPPDNTKYTCESFLQRGNVTESWSSLCPLTPCPPSALAPTSRPRTGTKPIDCTAAGLIACPCTGTSDPRACCTTTPPCIYSNSSGTACVPIDTSFIPADEFDCNRTSCAWTVTTTYTPPPPTCPDVVETFYSNKYGEKDTTCDNICTGWNAWSAWGNCLMAEGGAHMQSRTRTMRCNNPCVSSELYCPHEAENQTCKCDDGRTVAVVEGECTSTAPPPNYKYTFEVSASTTDNTKVACNCVATPLALPPTPDPPNECTTYEKLNEAPCRANDKHVWYNYPFCNCSCRNEETESDNCASLAGTWKTFPSCYCQPSGGTHSRWLCTSPSEFTIGPGGIADAVGHSSTDLASDIRLRPIVSNIQNREWISALAILLCGSYRPNDAHVQTLKNMIYDNPGNSRDNNGNFLCSDDPIIIVWTCGS